MSFDNRSRCLVKGRGQSTRGKQNSRVAQYISNATSMNRHCSYDRTYASRCPAHFSPYTVSEPTSNKILHSDPRVAGAHGSFFFYNGSVRLHAECWRPRNRALRPMSFCPPHGSIAPPGCTSGSVPSQSVPEASAIVLVHGMSDYAGWNKNFAEFLVRAVIVLR